MTAVSQEPTFALGDSSGIAPSVLYTLIMVDTTCPNKRVLHYARSNFKNNFDKTNIATESAALQDYKAPGAFGETGDTRQYSFLMYINPQRRQITSLQLPAEGEAFDVEKFQTDNGLQDPTAGVGMVVKLGGTADCGNDQPNGVPDSLPSPRPSRSTAAARPSQPAGGASSGAQATSTTAAGQRPSTTANSAPTASVPGNGTSGGDSNGPAPSGARTSGLVVASSAVQSGGLTTSTVVLSPDGAAGVSGTPSASPAEQTTNAAPGMSADGYGLLASLFAMAGLVMW
jgi:hypothetical protein